jgi:hypothetical protein
MPLGNIGLSPVTVATETLGGITSGATDTTTVVPAADEKILLLGAEVTMATPSAAALFDFKITSFGGSAYNRRVALAATASQILVPIYIPSIVFIEGNLGQTLTLTVDNNVGGAGNLVGVIVNVMYVKVKDAP